MAGERTTLTEAQIAARTNHYLEKVGRGKPKAKGTKSNPLKNKDLALMLKERFNKKNKNVSKPKSEAIAELNAQAEAQKPEAAKAKKVLTNEAAHRIENNVPQKTVDELNDLKTKLEAEEKAAAAKNQIEQPKAKPESKTWKKYLNERGMAYEQPISGVVTADENAKAAIAKNQIEQPKAKPETKTWKKYLNERGMSYEQPISGVVAADENAKAAIAKNQAEQPKAKPESKTWKKYLNERGMKYEQPISSVVNADKSAKAAIEKNKALRQEALNNAENINKPFRTSSAQIDKQLGLGHKNPVWPGYAEDYANMMDEKYGKVNTGKTGGSVPPSNAGNPGAAEGGAIKKPKTKGGFFSKIGKFFKGKGGKLALAVGAVALLAGLVKTCTGGKKEKPLPPHPEPQPQPQPKADKYELEKEEGKMPKNYTIKFGDYPSSIIMSTYGVDYGTPEYKEIQKAVYEASGYTKNTNLKVGDKFTLPDVNIGDKVYSANENAETVKGKVEDNGLPLGRTKEVVKENDKYYIIDKETRERIAGEGPFEDKDKAEKRLAELNEAE